MIDKVLSRFGASTAFLYVVAVMLMFVTYGCHPAPAFAQACEHPVAQEQAAWAAQGITAHEVDAKAVTDAIKLRLGETIVADQVFILEKPGMPNIAIVFSDGGCIFGLLVISISEFNALIAARAA